MLAQMTCPCDLRLGFFLVLLACQSTPRVGDAAPVNDAPPDVMSDAWRSDLGACQTLFGLPSEATGLGDERCAPSCLCGGESWTPPVYTAGDIAALRLRTLLDPPPVPAEDPYAEAPPEENADAVCAVLAEGEMEYRLQTFASEDSANSAGARVTHRGECGLCSSLADLAVYIEVRDLSAPVRQCVLMSLGGGDEGPTLECLRAIGFSPACAQIWYFNGLHTRDSCLRECLSRIDDPHHDGSGALNPCIQCDEDESGPIFKAVAGRTRRNSGIASALCRPCDSVARLGHLGYFE